jgi:hypothetical protein
MLKNVLVLFLISDIACFEEELEEKINLFSAIRRDFDFHCILKNFQQNSDLIENFKTLNACHRLHRARRAVFYDKLQQTENFVTVWTEFVTNFDQMVMDFTGN